MLVVLWLALIVYTYLDARRRISDPFLVACATVASFFPYIGTAVYAIVRPPEFLEDAHERELEIKAAELRVRQLKEQTCPSCEYPVEKSYLRCPNCQRRLKDPCPTCGKPVDPRWGLCPFCEATLAGGGGERPRRRQARAAEKEPAPNRPPARRKKAPAGKPAPNKTSANAERQEPARGAPQEASESKPEQRSPRREPDPDPRQA
jgi:Double zinc ribbon